ncbi:MAG: ChaN family lipoprotein [Phycisphaerales bacterium]|nr:ChaN family lipoprotein [Phycisphaerales bacterium]
MKKRLTGILLGSLLMAGCSATTTRNTDSESASDQMQMRDQARSVTIRNGDGSGIANWDQVVADMASADVVLFGEMHGHPLGLAVAQELWEDVLVHSPTAVLTMEFYERDQQIHVDDYLSGVTTREQFDKACKKTEKNNYPGHVRMIDAAKEAGRPVLAGNAPRRYVSMARKQGFESLEALGASQQAMFEMPIGDREGGYQDRFLELMSGMGDHSGEEIAAGFFRSQSVWDATMGKSVVDGLAMGSPVAQVVGYFHVQFGNEHGGSGLIDAVRLHGDLDLNRELRIVSIIQLARDDQELFMGTDDVLDDEGEISEEGEESDLGISTYVVYVGERE